jgi:hypothetical protein
MSAKRPAPYTIDEKTLEDADNNNQAPRPEDKLTSTRTYCSQNSASSPSRKTRKKLIITKSLKRKLRRKSLRKKQQQLNLKRRKSKRD